jgi:hypothetical protein
MPKNIIILFICKTCNPEGSKAKDRIVAGNARKNGWTKGGTSCKMM